MRRPEKLNGEIRKSEKGFTLIKADGGGLKKLEGLLGLSNKAGKLRSGETACEASVKNGKAQVLLLSSDTGPAIEKKFLNLCRSRSVPVIKTGLSTQRIGQLLGKGMRSVATVEDNNLAGAIIGTAEGGAAHEY